MGISTGSPLCDAIRIVAEPSFALTSPGFAFSAERFAALLALLLPLSPKLRSFTCSLCRGSTDGGRARFNTQNTLATKHFDGDALLVSPFDYLIGPAHVVALLRTRNLHRLAFTQEIDEGFPIDVAIFIRIVRHGPILQSRCAQASL
jgi:hypothetical protein